jgi:hypothetical protein
MEIRLPVSLAPEFHMLHVFAEKPRPAICKAGAPIECHETDGFHHTQGNHTGLTAGIAFQSCRFDRQKKGNSLDQAAGNKATTTIIKESQTAQSKKRA